MQHWLREQLVEAIRRNRANIARARAAGSPESALDTWIAEVRQLEAVLERETAKEEPPC